MNRRIPIKPVVSFLTAALLVCPAAVLAAPGDGGGGGGGGGGAPDYGDLFVLYRDANGVPILTPPTTAPDPEDPNSTVPAGQCQQPIALPSDTCPVTCTEDAPCLVPLDEITCGVAVGYETCTQEVDFARMNVARAPADVMARQLDDVVVNLATADCITLDPAGRLVYTSQDINDIDGDGDTTEYLTSAVDSPLQNLAIYKEMILYGQLGGDSPIELPVPFDGYGFLDTAAKGLGAASDKGGFIDVDLIVYLNQIMGLSDNETITQLPKECIYPRQEVQGVVQEVEKCFLLYTAYDYLRSETYGNLPFPAYIPAGDPEEGWFEYLDLYTGATGPGGKPLFWIVQGPILPAAFPDESTADESDFLPGFEDGNIGGLAQAADDARAVIEFMHSHPVLDGYETPLTCGAPHETAYDVSISPESGLQVPVRMVIGDEPREGVVTVANAGPDAASGTVTVTGMNPLGTRNLVAPMEFQFTNLASGASQSWTFPIELVVSWIPPRIFWEATVNAPYDVNSNNNTVEEVTTIIR